MSANQPGLTHSQEKELSGVMGKVSNLMEECSRVKKQHNLLEKENAGLHLSAKSLQQKLDDLQRRYGKAVKEIKEREVTSYSMEQVAVAGECIVKMSSYKSILLHCCCCLLFRRLCQAGC